MIRKIDLIMPPRSLYGVLHDFTFCMSKALERIGIQTRILSIDKEKPNLFLADLYKNPPDCTLSFNGLLPDKNGHFLSDVSGIPHIACIVDAFHRFGQLIHSTNTIITSGDQFDQQMFLNANFKKALFMPHAADSDSLKPVTNAKKDYEFDILCIGSFTLDILKKEWQKDYPEEISKTFDQAAETILSDKPVSSLQALLDSINQTGNLAALESYNFYRMLDQLERYINTTCLFDLIQELKNLKIHFVGRGSEIYWEAFGKPANMTYQKEVTFPVARELMAKSKAIVHAVPSIRYGGHERIFEGISAGALLLSNPNAFLRENFQNGESILFYDWNNLNGFSDLVSEMLENDSRRLSIVKNGQQIVKDKHTWDQRAAKLLSDVENFL